MAHVRLMMLFAGVFAWLLPTAARAVDCFVDSVAGDDSKSALSEADAVKSLSRIPTSCTTVKFKRGSVFNLAAGSKSYAVNLMGSKIKVLTNYGDSGQPLPQFIKPHQTGSGAVFSSYSQITIDGLFISGSRSDASMSNLADGICVMIGGGTAAQPSEIKNCEITLCDIGMMTSGDYVQVHDNYVHDLSISVDAPPGVDPNVVGGAEGIFVNSSHVRVHHNRFVNCSTAAQWVSNTNGGGVRCDGGATEVTVPNGKNGAAGEITDVEIDHNFSYNSCGFFEVSSMFQSGTSYVKGHFTDSVFHDNVMIDSGWISLLQVNNTKLINVRWENNTIVHHDMGSTTAADGTKINLNDFGSSAIQAIAFNSTSSGVTGGGEISPGDIYWTNNLWYFDPKVKPYNPIDVTHRGSDALLANITVTGDVVVTTDPGFKDITSKSDPAAYDLVAGSIAIDKGTSDDSIVKFVTLDFLGRARPAGGAYDLGAFEFGAPASSTGTGGVSGAGGSLATTSTPGGGNGGNGPATIAGAGGSRPATTVGAGGATGAGGNSTATSMPGSADGGSGPTTAAGAGGATPGTTAATGGGKEGCNCRVGPQAGRSRLWLGLAGLALLALRRRIGRVPGRIASRRRPCGQRAR